MKKYALLSIIFALTFNIINAQKCKPRHTETDEFTEKTKEYWGTPMTSMYVYSLRVKYLPSTYVYKDKDNYKINVVIRVKGKLSNDMLLNNHTWFEKGSKFYFKLENEVLDFTVEKNNVKQQSTVTIAVVESSITKEQIEKLNNQRILKGRVLPFVDNQDMLFQFKVAKGRDKVMKKQLTCLLKE